jgi:hypothetical protein
LNPKVKNPKRNNLGFMELHDFEKKNRKKKPNDEIKRLR